MNTEPLFTIGIICGDDQTYCQRLIDSVRSDAFSDVEIILVGGHGARDLDIHIPFDESAKPNWITKKKNIITKVARGRFIVYCHDYIEFLPGWFEGFALFGHCFKLCMTPILNQDGVTRYRDWCMWPDLIPSEISHDGVGMLLPYHISYLTDFMYFSGAYWIGEREFMLENPLNETLVWGEGEDLEWSRRVRAKAKFRLNPCSSVKLQKYKDAAFKDASGVLINDLTCYLLRDS